MTQLQNLKYHFIYDHTRNLITKIFIHYRIHVYSIKLRSVGCKHSKPLGMDSQQTKGSQGDELREVKGGRPK